MPSSGFSFTKTDYDVQVKDNNKVTTSFDNTTGVVTVFCYLRNPRRANAKYRLSHKVDGAGSYTEIATYPETAPEVFNTGGAWQKLLIKWEAFKDLSLKDHGTTTIQLLLWDDADNADSGNRVLIDTQDVELNLEPTVVKCIEPKDFGEGGASDFIFEIPFLRRSQKVVPTLKVSANSDMSSATTYTHTQFSKTSTNSITAFGDAGSGQLSVFFTKLTGDNISATDVVSITDTNTYSGTYEVLSADYSGDPEEIKITKDYVEGTDAETGMLVTSDPNTYFDATTTGLTIPSSQEVKFKFKMLTDADGQISIDANSYFTVELNCEEPS